MLVINYQYINCMAAIGRRSKQSEKTNIVVSSKYFLASSYVGATLEGPDATIELRIWHDRTVWV